VFTAVAPMRLSLEILADHFENITRLSMHNGLD
jgi:hypothetical protein